MHTAVRPGIAGPTAHPDLPTIWPWSSLDHPEALLQRGQEAMERRDHRTAAHLFALAGGMSLPDERAATRWMNRAVRQLIPRWHFAMLNDEARNEAYRAAIASAVRPGDVVLDIGTGAGLLALFAAAQGAELVVTCEVEPLLAAVARRVIADSGLGNRIRVVEAHSTELRVGIDLPRRADVLVSEIFDCALLGEGALPAFGHARQSLLRQGAVMVPGRGRLLGQLVESSALYACNSVSTVSGFDLSVFEQFRSLEYFSTYVSNYPHRMLSEPFVIFDFDFHSDEVPVRCELEIPVTSTGTCHAVVMWFELDLAPGIVHSNGIDQSGTHWRQAVQTFRAPIAVTAGSQARVTAAHDHERVLVWPSAGPFIDLPRTFGRARAGRTPTNEASSGRQPRGAM
jgi:type II protein arginine methyltransferase